MSLSFCHANYPHQHCFHKTFLFNSNWSANWLDSGLAMAEKRENKKTSEKSRRQETEPSGIKMMNKESNKWAKRQEEPLDVDVFIMRKWKVDTLNVYDKFSTINTVRAAREACVGAVHEVARSRPIDAIRGGNEWRQRKKGRRKSIAKKTRQRLEISLSAKVSRR